MGDFPAVIIMTSNITSFTGYLIHAFPLFAATSAVLAGFWIIRIREENDDGSVRRMAVSCLKSQYKYIQVRYDVLRPLLLILAGMFFAWSFVPQNMMPPEVISILGYAAAAAVCSLKGIRILQNIDFKSVLTIAAFLFMAEAVSQTGILSAMAEYLKSNISDTKLLVFIVMIITSLFAGIFSAGPAAAAMMPVIAEICRDLPAGTCDWIAVIFAAAVCSGSSLFMWSATAGFILSDKIRSAKIKNEKGEYVKWGITRYMKYGIINYLIQTGIAAAAVWIVL